MPRTLQEAVRVDDLLAERRPAELRVVVAGFNGGGGPYRPLYAGHDVLYDLALYAWVHQATWRFEEHRNFWAGMRALWPPPRGVPPVRPVLVAACVVLLESHVGLSDATDFAGALGYKFATLRHYGVVAEAQRLLDLPVDARPPDAAPWWFPYVYAENETPPTPPGPARAPDGIHTLLARAYRHVAERDGHELLIDQNGAAIDGRALPWAPLSPRAGRRPLRAVRTCWRKMDLHLLGVRSHPRTRRTRESSSVRRGSNPQRARHRRAPNMCRDVTWGRTSGMSRAFYEQYFAETLVYVSDEMLVNGVSREGLDADALNADLAALRP